MRHPVWSQIHTDNTTMAEISFRALQEKQLEIIHLVRNTDLTVDTLQ
jgi:hypothetical protein